MNDFPRDISLQNLYAKKIDEKLTKEQHLLDNFKIMNWNNHKFSYVPLDTSSLQSLYTDLDVNYQQCIQMIEGYNKEVDYCKQRQREIEDGPWKNKFYGTLQSLCREVIFTKDDRILQKKFAKNISQWALAQLQRRSERLLVPQETDQGSQNISKVLPSIPSQKQRSITGQTTFSALDTTAAGGEASFNTQSQQGAASRRDHRSQSGQSQDQNLPSSIQNKILDDYRKGRRTRHKDTDPPDQKLGLHKRRQLDFEDPTKQLVQDLERKKKELEGRITYPKPVGYMPQKEEELPLGEANEVQEEKQEVDEGGDEGGQGEGAQIDDGGAGGDVLDGEEGEGGAGGQEQGEVEGDKKMVPHPKPFSKEEWEFQMNVQNRDVSKNFESKNIYLNYVPSQKIKEETLTNIWLKHKNKELREKRSTEEVVKMMQEWSHARGRIEKEIIHKIDRKAYGNNFKECEFKQNFYSRKEQDEIKLGIISEEIGEEEMKQIIENKNKQMEVAKYQEENQKKQPPYNRKKAYTVHPTSDNKKISDLTSSEQALLPLIAKNDQQIKKLDTHQLEYKIGKQRIANAKKLYGDIINLQKQDEDEDKPRVQASLSVYQNNIAKVNLRPFSAIFDQLNSEEVKNQQIQEIEDVKNRMAKYRINIPIKKLMDSMLIPEGLAADKIDNLPEPGLQLLSNPFFPVTKKKGGKKKKK